MSYPKLTDEPGAAALAEQIAAGDLSPLEAVDAAIARIEAMDGGLNAIVVRDFDRARERAKALDGLDIMPHQQLFGVPMTVKESFDIAGLPSCWGHRAHVKNVAAHDADVPRRLKQAGAIILGKTNVPVDLTDWQSVNPVYGRTRNPHDRARSPGGSSGGSAAAVASGMVPCEFGTDIGGSVRVPAHFCGIWAHKASWGLVSKQGHDHPQLAGKAGHDGALSIAGPLARNAADLDLLLRLTAKLPVNSRPKSIAESRFLLLLDHPVSEVDESVRQPIESAANALQAQGIEVDIGSELVPDLERQHSDYLKMLNIAMARGMPGPSGKRANATDWFDLLDLQTRCEIAWAKLFESYDFVLAPPAPILAFEHRDEPFFEGKVEINGHETRAADGLAWAGLATFPNLPATVLPVGESDGLPCGIQVMGPHWRDLDCIDTARQIGEILHG